MDTQKILKSDLLDIIFDNRNKDYGAYELRRNYARRVRKGFASVALVALTTFSIALAVLNEEPVQASSGVPFHPINPDLPSLPPDQPDAAQPKPHHPDPVDETDTGIPTVIDDAIDVTPPDPQEPIQGNDEGDDTAPSSNSSGGQGTSPIDHPNTGKQPIADPEPTPEPSSPIDMVDVQVYPEFPGGEDELMRYLMSHLKYPEEAVRSNISGRVTLGFVVNKNGEIDDIKVLRSVGYGCDEEAVRVVKSMPGWKPAMNNGKPVNVYFNLPITFELQN